MAKLKIYKTEIVPARNFLVQDIDEYLGSLTPSYEDNAFQFIKPLIDTNIKINVAFDGIEDTALIPLLGNYVSIEESIDGTDKTFYYYIMGATFMAESTVSLQLSMDTINTFSDYLYDVDNYTAMTNISRETRKRWDWNTTLSFKPLIDKHSENLNLSPASYYRSKIQTVNESGDFAGRDWYVVYKTRNSVISSGSSSSASENIIDTFLVPSQATTLVDYSYTGDYDGIEAGYDGGYDPVTAETASDDYGIQFEVVDYAESGAPATYTEIPSRWYVDGDRITVYTNAIATLVDIIDITQGQGVYQAACHRWTAPYLTDQYNRRWNLYRAYMSGQSADNSGYSSKLYITGIYYNQELGKYIGVRGAGGYSGFHAYIYSSNTDTYVNSEASTLTDAIKFGANANTVPEYTQFDDPGSIKLNVTGNACSDVYSGKIWIYFPKNIKSIKSYNSNTNTYSSNFFNNTASGSTVHEVYKYLEGYDTLVRTDSKLIKIIRCPYCPVEYHKETIQNGYSYIFDGFRQAATSTANVVTLQKESNPTNFSVELTPISQDLTANVGRIYNYRDFITDDYLYNCEPKLKYGQDTLVRKYAFDNQVLSIPYENYDTNEFGLATAKDNVSYMHTRELSSDLLFQIQPDDAANNASSYTNYDYGNILLSSRNLEEPILNNDYLNYMRYGYNYEKSTMEQNISAQQISTGISTATSVIGGTVGGAVAGGLKGGVPGAVIGAIIGLGSSILSSTSKIISMNASIDAAKSSFAQKLDTLRNQSTSISSNNAVDLFDKYADVKLKYIEYRTVEQLRKPIANLYHYCGYSHPVQEKPQWTRYWFDFIQCSPVFKDNIFRNIYGDYQQDIVYRFENGVTVLHNRGYDTPEYNFEQNKQNWETDLLISPVITSVTSDDNVVYSGPSGSRTVNGIKYYRWEHQWGAYNTECFTTSQTPSIGDVLYGYARYPQSHVFQIATVLHVNYSAGSTQIPNLKSMYINTNNNITLVLKADENYEPKSSNDLRYEVYYVMPGGQETRLALTSIQNIRLDIEVPAEAIAIKARIVDTGNICTASAFSTIDLTKPIQFENSLEEDYFRDPTKDGEYDGDFYYGWWYDGRTIGCTETDTPEVNTIVYDWDEQFTGQDTIMNITYWSDVR